MRITGLTAVGFEDKGEGHAESRDVGSPWKLGTAPLTASWQENGTLIPTQSNQMLPTTLVSRKHIFL